jgi:hypothetical protein
MDQNNQTAPINDELRLVRGRPLGLTPGSPNLRGTDLPQNPGHRRRSKLGGARRLEDGMAAQVAGAGIETIRLALRRPSAAGRLAPQSA